MLNSSSEPSSPKKMATSRLKAIMAPRNHRRNPSDGTSISPPKLPTKKENTDPNLTGNTPLQYCLPLDHPHGGQHLREESRNRDNMRNSPQKPIEVYEDDSKSFGLHKRTKSSVSLKSLIGNEKVKGRKPSSPEKQDGKKPKKSKSSTSLSAILSKAKSSKDLPLDGESEPKDKENRTPPSTGSVAPPPIWAQFASQPLDACGNYTKVPLNDARSIADDIALYTAPQYSPSKGRNFMDYGTPTLARKAESKPRPMSALLPSSTSKTSFSDTLSGLRKRGQDNSQSRPTSDNSQSGNYVESRRLSSDKRRYAQRASTEQQRKSEEADASTAVVKGASRVMAVVAAFNGKSQNTVTSLEVTTKPQEPPLDAKAIDTAFESLLVSPHHLRRVAERIWSIHTDPNVGFEEYSSTGERQDEILEH